MDEQLEQDFEWKDLLIEPEKNLERRLKSLRFDDLINIVSGKISDLELHENLNDQRPIKTAAQMDEFILGLVVETESKKQLRIEEKERIRKREEKMNKQFKDGFGTLLLMGVNNKSEEEDISDLYKKLDHHQYQKLFNQFLVNNNMQPRSVSEDQRDKKNQDQEQTQGKNIISKNFGTSEELVDELIVEIDKTIENRLEQIIEMAEGDGQNLREIIQGMLNSNDPAYTKLALFLKNYRRESMKTDLAWMKEDKENDSDSDSSDVQSPKRISPTKSIGERYSPIRLREF